MSAPGTLELIWQQDATALALLRSGDGSLSAGDLRVGSPTEARLLGRRVEARRVDHRELLRLAAAPESSPAARPASPSRSPTSRTARSPKGFVHPYLDEDDGTWNAFWGATLDASVTAQLTQLAAALPPAAADAFGGDREETVHDLYPVLVDRIARDRLRAARIRLVRPAAARPRSSASSRASPPTSPRSRPAPATPPSPAASRVDARRALARSEASWRLGLRLDERPPDLLLQLWLHAADDPTVSLPASLLEEGGDEVFSFLRASDARRDLARQLTAIEPLLAERGFEFRGDAAEAPIAPDEVGPFLRETMPRARRAGRPRPAAGRVGARPKRVRLNLTATTRPSSGLLSTQALARFDWKLAVGDETLTEEELRELARQKEPFVRVGGRWHAVRQSEVERALRFLERRRGEAGIVDLVRAVSGLETEELGLELGAVELDLALQDLLAGEHDRRFRPLPTPAAMRFDLFPFQERGHGWLRLLGDLGIGAVLADDMGLGKTVQAIAMLASEREDGASPGPTLVVAPMRVVKQWGAEIERFAPSFRVHLHHGTSGSGARRRPRRRSPDVVVTSYDLVARDIADLDGSAGTGCCSTRHRT